MQTSGWGASLGAIKRAIELKRMGEEARVNKIERLQVFFDRVASFAQRTVDVANDPETDFNPTEINGFLYEKLRSAGAELEEILWKLWNS